MAARRNSKAPKVEAINSIGAGEIWAEVQQLRCDVIALREAVEALTALTEGEVNTDGVDALREAEVEKAVTKPASTRKPKAAAPKDDPFVKGCRFTYLNAKGAASQHRVVEADHDDFVVCRSLRKGSQPRQWKRTTLAAMLQTGNVVLKAN